MPVMELDDAEIAYDVEGRGPPVLLLHGFPQTRAMWSVVVPKLSNRFTVVTADLRGYGASRGVETGVNAHAFRAKAGDMRALMTALGFERFHLVGHDRGARVAHRLALDTPDTVETLTVMDILPTLYLLENWTVELSLAYWHWSFLATPGPFAEDIIARDPDHFFEACLTSWGGAQLSEFGSLGAYREAWRRPEVIAAMANDYRAAVGPDRAHDMVDRNTVLAMPALVLYGADGVMARQFDVAHVWSERLSDMIAQPMPGGHFFIDLAPNETVAALLEFLSR